jgi:hypothetical protein
LTNIQLIRATREAEKRQQQRLQFFEEYNTVNRTMAGAERLWSLYSESNPFVTVDADGNYKYNPNTPDWRTWFRSQQGRSLDEPRGQGRATTQAEPKVATQADIDETARANNITPQQARDRLIQRGFTIQGGQ